MTQANEPETSEAAPPQSVRREASVAVGPQRLDAMEQRASRVLMRIPDCSARLSTGGSEAAAWRAKLQTLSELGGPWLNYVRPVLPPRVLAASLIGILLGIVLIVLTPGEKRIPEIHTHVKQAANEQRPMAPPPADDRAGPRANEGTTGAAAAAAQPNSPARVDSSSPPRYENARLPANTPATTGKSHAVLDGIIQTIH